MSRIRNTGVNQEKKEGKTHKVRTYKKYHSVCPSSELGLSQPLSHQRVFPSPQKQGGGGTLACGWGVEGSPNSDEGHTLWYSLYVRTLWKNRFLIIMCGTYILGLLLELLDGPLVDAAALVDEMAGGGGLARVHVTNHNDVDVNLFLSHG
jgi:hypothetical protein